MVLPPPPKYRGPPVQKACGALTVRDVRLSVNCEIINNYNVCYITPRTASPLLTFTLATRFELPRLQLRMVLAPSPYTKENMYACVTGPGELTLQRDECDRPTIPPGCYMAKGLYAPNGGFPQGDYLLKMRAWGTHEDKPKQLFTSIVKIHSIDMDSIALPKDDSGDSDMDFDHQVYKNFREV